VKMAALIVAGGAGSRASAGLPKQYARLGGITMLSRAVRAFAASHVDAIQVVIAAGEGERYAAAIADINDPRLLPPVVGGRTRQVSARNGLVALRPHAPDLVLIHDAARPFVTGDIIARVGAALTDGPAAIAAVPLADTVKEVGDDGKVAATLDRGRLWGAQTPQGFHYGHILAAHVRAEAAGIENLTDDAAVAEWAGLPVTLVLGSPSNRKITTVEDLAMAERSLFAPDIRVGQGFDVHRLVKGDHVWLCGIRIPHTHALEGHSDADVGLHALTDALLGAIGDGDIGQHFPNTDPRWKGAPSHLFLAEAARRVAMRGGSIGNADVTILCEAPKIAPHREAMRERIAEVLGVDTARVGVKATTTEGLGFTGRREGIAALATATVILC
jgi:2-C-methyl-D-erythritol 4-phosphate cytidylyltransferase / 2-C-methyl-D-erythritol 2,4-cyclodiphosphate synthase